MGKCARFVLVSGGEHFGTGSGTMITNRKMRGLLAIVALAAGMTLSHGASAASVSTSCATPDPNVHTTTCFFDLTASPSSTQTPASAVLNGGIFRVPAQTDDPLGKGFIVGTGV